ncbi:hypothetical protein M9Y10_026377 [Tritrichomonas musculus]|uniref:Uncharacterized protein n=1 Tax=Tritrichomonas musculus TaxID=1915356 RepID=A0ABR2H7H2_9EUKA
MISIPSNIDKKYLGINSNAQIIPSSLFLNAFMNVTFPSYAIGYVNQASAPFIFRKAIKDIFSIAVSIDYKPTINEKCIFIKDSDEIDDDIDGHKLKS